MDINAEVFFLCRVTEWHCTIKKKSCLFIKQYPPLHLGKENADPRQRGTKHSPSSTGHQVNEPDSGEPSMLISIQNKGVFCATVIDIKNSEQNYK